MTLLLALATCSACVEASPDLDSAEQASEVPAEVIQRLNETGGSATGITYSIPPPVGDQPSPVVLTSRPLEGLSRQYEFPSVAEAFDVRLSNLPPGSYKSSLVTRVFRARDTANPLAMLAVSADPSTGERWRIRREPSNMRCSLRWRILEAMTRRRIR